MWDDVNKRFLISFAAFMLLLGLLAAILFWGSDAHGGHTDSTEPPGSTLESQEPPSPSSDPADTLPDESTGPNAAIPDIDPSVPVVTVPLIPEPEPTQPSIDSSDTLPDLA